MRLAALRNHFENGIEIAPALLCFNAARRIPGRHLGKPSPGEKETAGRTTGPPRECEIGAQNLSFFRNQVQGAKSARAAWHNWGPSHTE